MFLVALIVSSIVSRSNLQAGETECRCKRSLVEKERHLLSDLPTLSPGASSSLAHLIQSQGKAPWGRGCRSSSEFILYFRSPVGRYQHFVDLLTLSLHILFYS